MLPEPCNSMALVLLGALAGAWLFGSACGCVGRWRWRRWVGRWQARQDRPFCELPAGHTARFLALAAAARTEQRARDLARRSQKESA